MSDRYQPNNAILIEGRTLKQIGAEHGISWKTLAERYRDPRVPKTIEGIVASREKRTSLLGMTTSQWSRYLAPRSRSRNRTTASHLAKFIRYHRDTGKTDQVIARLLLETHGITAEQLEHDASKYRPKG